MRNRVGKSLASDSLAFLLVFNAEVMSPCMTDQALQACELAPSSDIFSTSLILDYITSCREISISLSPEVSSVLIFPLKPVRDEGPSGSEAEP
jgi:hypothetical protein